jgi:hypothetical protein
MVENYGLTNRLGWDDSRRHEGTNLALVKTLRGLVGGVEPTQWLETQKLRSHPCLTTNRNEVEWEERLRADVHTHLSHRRCGPGRDVRKVAILMVVGGMRLRGRA